MPLEVLKVKCSGLLYYVGRILATNTVVLEADRKRSLLALVRDISGFKSRVLLSLLKCTFV